MNLSAKTEYALHALFDLAAKGVQEPVKIADIARRQQIPQKFLELILANLKQGGFVESRRGADGGYRLARPASEITVGQVFRYVEGVQPEKKQRNGNSPFANLWRTVDECAEALLDRTTFEALAREWADHQSRFVPNWEI